MSLRLSALSLLALTLAACAPAGGDSTGISTRPVQCSAYCGTYMANCTNANNEYTSESDCETQCGAWTQGQPGDTSGNSVTCHDTYAKQANDNGACGDAGPNSTTCI